MTITNLFIILNLGCEMLYVIDQRLKAQAIPLDKSAQGTLVSVWFPFITKKYKKSTNKWGVKITNLIGRRFFIVK